MSELTGLSKSRWSKPQTYLVGWSIFAHFCKPLIDTQHGPIRVIRLRQIYPLWLWFSPWGLWHQLDVVDTPRLNRINPGDALGLIQQCVPVIGFCEELNPLLHGDFPWLVQLLSVLEERSEFGGELFCHSRIMQPLETSRR